MRRTLAALRALIVTHRPPVPEGGAAARCAVGLLRGLLSLGIDAHTLSAYSPWDPHDVPDDLPVELVRLPHQPPGRIRWDRYVNPGGALARGLFAERLRVLARHSDVVHFIEADTAVGIRMVDRPSVTQLHYLTRRDRDLVPLWRQEGRVALELLRLERRACSRSRWLLANSVEVANDLIAAASDTTVTVAPLSLDPGHYRGSASLERPVAGLLGTARWPPTRNAVERLLRRVWPRILERSPEALLVLAGDGMERSNFPHLPDRPGVEWRGRVLDAADFLRELGVLLYPLTAGSGAKVKVLEALALGLPVVTTPDGAEGIVDRGGISVETDDDRIADAAVALLTDAASRCAAGAAAHWTFVRHHSPVPAARPVVELYERMIYESRRGHVPLLRRAMGRGATVTGAGRGALQPERDDAS